MKYNIIKNVKLRPKGIFRNITGWLWWLILVTGITLSSFITSMLEFVRYVMTINKFKDVLDGKQESINHTASVHNISRHSEYCKIVFTRKHMLAEW